jgi:predicted nucleotidyltransferase
MELKEHKQFSERRIAELKDAIARIPELKKNKLCVFVTGSYGRLEASEHSDIDLFFLDTGKTSNIDTVLINAEIIKICRNLKLPELSKDGLYLKAHRLKDIKEHLGGPADDYNNFYTTRMLLLLESQFLYNKELFNQCIDEIIDSYYIDFHHHTDNFQPIFLANDIIRFWKTLCLNYEHKRIQKKDDDTNTKNIEHSKNLKLKFSRKLICFSFILKLVNCQKPISKKQIKEIMHMTPIERLQSIQKESKNSKIKSNIQNIIDDYQWFINHTQVESETMLLWIADKKTRDDAFKKSNQFGQNLYNVLNEVDRNKLISKLLI